SSRVRGRMRPASTNPSRRSKTSSASSGRAGRTATATPSAADEGRGCGSVTGGITSWSNRDANHASSASSYSEYPLMSSSTSSASSESEGRGVRRNTATTSSTGTTNSTLFGSRSTGIAFFGWNSTLSYLLTGNSSSFSTSTLTSTTRPVIVGISA